VSSKPGYSRHFSQASEMTLGRSHCPPGKETESGSYAPHTGVTGVFACPEGQFFLRSKPATHPTAGARETPQR
jgi:hypothetical protein